VPSVTPRPRYQSVRVCFTSPYSVARIGGVGRFIQSLADCFHRLGVECEAIYPYPSYSTQSWFGAVVPLRMTHFRNLELAYRTAAVLLRRHAGYTIIHAQQVHLQSLAAVFVAHLLQIPCIVTVHLRDPPTKGALKKFVQSLIERLVLRAATRVVAVSQPVADSLGPRNTLVVENGVDTKVFRPLEAERREIRRSLGVEDSPLFIFVGRWSRHKGLDLLLSAIGSTLLRSRSYHLAILGERTSDLIGPVRDLPAYLSAADILILPSRKEGMPLAFLEAMACGLPVLASNIDVHRILFERTGCGWLFPSEDAHELAKVLAQIIDQGLDPSWRTKSRAMAEKYFDIERTATRYLEIFRDAISP